MALDEGIAAILEDPDPGNGVIAPEQWEPIGTELGLSGRELQVVQLIFQLKTRKEIACALGISPHTVRVYIDRLSEKCNINDDVQLVLRIIRTQERLFPPCGNLPTESA